MVIKLVANKFLSQNDFLIWEELLLCEKYIFWIFDAKCCSVPGNHWMLIWAYHKKKRRDESIQLWKSEVSSEINFSFETNFRNIEENSFNFGKTSVHTSKLHLLRYLNLLYNCIIAWLIEIDLFKQMGLCFFSPCCIKFNMAQ